MTDGVLVAAGDVLGNGVTDVITGPINGTSPVRVFDGATGGNVIREIVADPTNTGGFSVGVGDVNGDGRVEILIGSGKNSGPTAWVYGPSLTPLAGYTAFDAAFLGGVFVG
jgi:hypothetical protein